MNQTKLAAICPPDPTGFFSRAPFAAESETSEAAAKHMDRTGRTAWVRNRVYDVLRLMSVDFDGGMTDEEISLYMQPTRHTSVVSARNHLVKNDLVSDSGRVRTSPTSGRAATVWEVVR